MANKKGLTIWQGLINPLSCYPGQVTCTCFAGQEKLFLNCPEKKNVAMNFSNFS